VLLAEARKLAESADRAARLTQRAAAPSPQLIVAAKPDSDAGLLPAMLERYQGDPGRPPAVLLFRDTHELAPALRSGRADVALIVGPADCEGLDTDELWHEPRVVILPAGHALAGRGAITMADLGDEPVVRWADVPASLDRYYRGLDQGPGSQPGRPGPAATSLLEALRLAELGHGVTFLPQSVAARFRRPGLAARPVAGLPGSTAVAAWRAGSRDPAVAAFARAAFEVAAAQPAWPGRRAVSPEDNEMHGCVPAD
jgi:DNA-binding transcriptional LysR family regulator